MENNRQRIASCERVTGETAVKLRLNLDGEGRTSIATGFGLFDHMLTLLIFWAGMDLELVCKGDIQVDAHHSVEDIGLTLGSALLQALGERRGIARTAYARVPMDEACAEVAIDLSGRPWLVWMGDELLPPVLAGEEKDIWREFYKAFASSGMFNLHVCFLYGKNGHHLLESCAKGLGMALRAAVRREGDTVRSTKGVI